MRRTIEFPEAFEALDDEARRRVLKAMGAALAMSGLAACEGEPDPRAMPYVNAPENLIPGQPRFYATATTMGGYAQPVVGETYDGRPTKLEGLPAHPASQGATDAFTQAQILGLYDPDRSQAPRHMGRPASWAMLEAAMVENARLLDARGGEGLRLLTGTVTSPTFERQLKALAERWPKARWHVLEPVGEDGVFEASRLAFGRPLSIQFKLEQAQAIVCLDADILGPGPHQTARARAWSQARAAFHASDASPCRLMAVEPAPSQTGAMAADRLVASFGRVGVLADALAKACDRAGRPVGLSVREAHWVEAAAWMLKSAPGRALVVAGPQQPPEVQALALQLSARLGALGQTLTLTEPVVLQPPDGAASFAVLVRDMEAGRVDTLAVLGPNPTYAGHADLLFKAATGKVRTVVNAGLYADETAALAHWHAPLSHDLESWGDARSGDGRASLIQPLVRPLYDTRTASVLLETLQGRPGASDRDLVMTTWKATWSQGFDARWTATLAKGFVDEPATPVEATLGPPPAPAPLPGGDLDILFRPDPCVWDGRFANNAWLQELPKPFTTLTWDNVVAISPALAKTLGVGDGEVVKVSANGRAIEGPAWITPGQERRTVVVYLGYGRRLPGALADGLGYDAYALRTSQSPWRTTGKVVKAGKSVKLAPVQRVRGEGDADFVRSAPPAQARTAKRSVKTPSFYPDIAQASPQWGMSIDLDLCIGCNACAVACQSENNVPTVGKDQVVKGRHMHWLRIDQYWQGPEDEPQLAFQPTPCMHCEEAPCEIGCPVNATTHSAEGLNQQVYNRCIGTRTCSSYCPYKVRRFNWFDFTGKDAPSIQAARNPDVTVRSRGVMEKCTYCVQRINETRIAAQLENRGIRDGEVRTACQQACPTQAIVFGDVSKSDTTVSRKKAQARDYVTIEEANTRPRTSYLARIKAEGA